MATAAQKQELQVRVSADAMLAQLRVPPGIEPDLLTRDFCLSLFRMADVPENSQLLESVRQAIEQFNEDQDAEVLIECRGKQPVAGTDARLEWADGCDPALPREPALEDDGRNDETRDTAPDADDQNVDYYNVVHYVAVERDQHLATLIPATTGEQGHDVTGRPLVPSAGKEFTINTDDSVELTSEGKFIARVSGVLQFRDNTMQISPCLNIDQYVDFSTGNIDFDGDVEIKRGVRDKFVVRATGNIEVGGLIEAAVIEAGGDFNARTGMAAKDTGHIRIEGNLTAKYLECVHGVVKKDVEVRRGILHCYIDVCGDLHIERGAIQGGRIRITGAAFVGDLGSPSGEETLIVLGYAPSIQAHLAVVDQYLEECERECEQTGGQLRMLQSAGAGHISSQQAEMAELACALSMLQSRVTRIEQKKQSLLDHLDRIRKIDLTVEKAIHPGTTIVLDGVSRTFDEPIKGPLWIGWDDRRELIVKDTVSDSVAHVGTVTRTFVLPRETFSAADLRPDVP